MIHGKMAPWSFETSGTIHQKTLHHITEDVIPEKGLCENPKYRTTYPPPYIFRVTDTFRDILGTWALLYAQLALYLCVLYGCRSKQLALTETPL
jgi:hypothetical protein